MDKEKLAKRLGQRIAALRKERGMTQTDLASEIGKDRQAIDRIERGMVNTTVYTASLIAGALGMSLSELFEFSLPRK